MQSYTIIFGLKKFESSLSFYYPEVFIAKSKDNKPQYMDKVATDEVIKSYGFDSKDPVYAKLLDLCQELNPFVMEEKLQKDKKRKLSLLQLFESDSNIKNLILKKVDFGLSRFLDIIRKNKLPLYHEVERKIYLPEIEIKFSQIEVIPFVKFEKTATGTNYFLYLKVNGETITPKEQAIEIITNQPAMILQNYHLYEMQKINANKLAPFLKNEKIFIPDRITKQYFTTFIKEIIGTVDVEVQGFDYTVKSPLPECVIKFSRGFYNDNYEVLPYFYYDEVRFQFGEKSLQRVNVAIEDNGQIKVVQINRNSEQEEEMTSLLIQLGFEATPANRLVKNDEADIFESLMQIIRNEALLLSKGWKIEYPVINEKPLNTGVTSIKETIQKENDWFDIYASVMVGDQLVKFVSLMEFIKNGERIFTLPDGSCFVIPIEWMSKYAALAKFSEFKEDHLSLKKSHYTILEDLDQGQLKKSLKTYVVNDDDFEFVVPAGVNASLRAYQIEGAKWLIKHYKNKLGACLADDMGLGKTLQTLTLLQYVKEDISKEKVLEDNQSSPLQLSLFESYVEKRKPLTSIIVCPATLVHNWEREIKKFTSSLISTIHIGDGRIKNPNTLSQFDIIITSYQTLLKDIKLFEQIAFQYAILDEAHYIKNRDSQIFKAIKRIKTTNKVSLSGTPIENSLADLWSQMEFINPDILGTYPSFKKVFQDAIEKYKDEEAMTELKKMLSPFILRRTKKEVLLELPDVEEQIILSEMTEEQKKLSETEKSKARNMILSSEYDHKMKFHVLAAILKLRQLANHPALVDGESVLSSGKYEDITNTVETLLAGDNKMLIFSSFISHLNLIEKYLIDKKINYSRLTGEENAKEKKRAEDVFQNNEMCSVMLISLKAGGVGLNLTAANYVLILDPWWNPYPEEQAIGRAHRIGQNNKVTVIRFISKDSIEEKIMRLQEKKMELVDNFMDFDAMPKFDEATILELLN